MCLPDPDLVYCFACGEEPMADNFAAFEACIIALRPLDPGGRRRVLHALTASFDLVEEHVPSLPDLAPPTAPVQAPPAPRTTLAKRETKPPKADHPKGRVEPRAVHWSDVNRERADQIVSLLRTSKDGMMPVMLARAMGTTASKLATALRSMLIEQKVRTTGVRGSKACRYHLMESPS